jgi:hypothetical protein
MSWPTPLEHFVEHPIEHPICPTVCCFRRYCRPWVQSGIDRSFTSGEFKSHRDCFFFQGLAELTVQELGSEPPETAAGFLELVAERLGLQGEPA